MKLKSLLTGLINSLTMMAVSQCLNPLESGQSFRQRVSQVEELVEYKEEDRMKIEREKSLNWIRITEDSGAFLRSQSVEVNLLFEILQKLEEIRCGLIDVENVVAGV